MPATRSASSAPQLEQLDGPGGPGLGTLVFLTLFGVTGVVRNRLGATRNSEHPRADVRCATR
jgi:hypothetical protein